MKIRLKMNITRKLFIITTIVFAFFIAGTLIMQSVFFESFYMNKKKSEFKNDIESFKKSYIMLMNKNSTSTESIDEYVHNPDIRIIIFDSEGQPIFNSIHNMNKNDLVNLAETNEYIRSWVKNNKNQVYLKQQNKTLTLTLRAGRLRGDVLVGVTPVNDRNETIVAISSMERISEASGVIKQFYPYFSIGALFFILLLSLIHSALISKPLVRINRVATKMANLDFTEKCEVDRQDEIGNVAVSLNFLSGNLSNALTSLTEANKKLEADIEKERKLERMRREFVASVSHELKTPISLIDGYANGLKDDIFENEEKDMYLDIIIDEAEKMGHLVSEMLDLSVLESDNFKLTLEEFNLSELICFTIKKYKSMIDEKNIKLYTQLIDNIRVNADWSRMEQVITNFLTNALRYGENDGEIYVKMFRNNKNTVVEVENTGSHIPEGELDKIWDKFYKVDKSGNRKIGGTGIGLAIVKNILTLHKYPFGVVNTDKGVKFYFTVPGEDEQKGEADI